MFNLSAGPPFDHQPNGAGAAAQDLASQVGGIQTLAGNVTSAHSGAQSSVGGLLTAPMASAPVPAVRGIQRVSRSAMFAAGALQLFADAVDTYNGRIDQLNEAWTTAEADDFGVAPPYVPGNATPEQARDAQSQYDAAVDAAREKLREELRSKQRAAEQALDDATRDARAMLRRGPNDADVNAMADAGIFPRLLRGLRGQAIPLDLSMLGLGIFGAGRGLKALDLYAQYAATAARHQIRYPAAGAPRLNLREMRQLRSQMSRYTQLSSRLLGPAGNAIVTFDNIRRDGPAQGGAQALTGIRAGAWCASQVTGATAGRTHPAVTVIGSGVVGTFCGIVGTETARQVAENGAEVVEDTVGGPTVEPSRYGPPVLTWDAPGWVDDVEGAVEEGASTAYDNTIGRIPGL